MVQAVPDTDPKATKPAESPAADLGDDKSFADFLGQIFEGKAKDIGGSLEHFAKQLVDQRLAHQKLSGEIRQAEQALQQLQAQAIKIAGAFEQTTATVRHFWAKKG